MTYIPQIAALGQEQQRIVAERGSYARLAEIESELARLWELQRRLKAGAGAVAPEPPKPAPLPVQRQPLPPLPLGVAWINHHKRPRPPTVRACVYLGRHDKVYLSSFPSTPEGTARAALAAAAGRSARDAGADREGIVRAMREAVHG